MDSLRFLFKKFLRLLISIWRLSEETPESKRESPLEYHQFSNPKFDITLLTNTLFP